MNLNLTDEFKLFSKLALVNPMDPDKSLKNALKKVDNEIYEDFPQFIGKIEPVIEKM